MRRAGDNVLARWREAGEWWSGEPYREYVRRIDAKGIRREEEAQDYPSLGLLDEAEPLLPEIQEDHSEEWSLRRRMRTELIKTVEERYESYKAKSVRRRLNSMDAVYEASAEPDSIAYVPLHCLSGYAYGRGLTHASELPGFAAMAGAPAAVIADPFSLTGAVEFCKAARKVEIKPLVGASFEMAEGGELVLIARSSAGYRSLSRLITRCHLEEPRLYPLCDWTRLGECSEDLICLTGGDSGPINRLVLRGEMEAAEASLRRLMEIYGRAHVFVEIERSYLPWEISVNGHLMDLAGRLGLTAVAGGVVTHNRPEQYPAQDILVCAETLCTVEELVGRKPPRDPSQPPACPRPSRSLNAERFLRSSAEMTRLYHDRPDLLINTRRIAELCSDDVLPVRTSLPQLYDDDDRALREITFIGAHSRHASGLTKPYRRRLERELERIARLGYSRHFLTIWDTCRWAREQGILFSGRGSVVDSCVAYALGMSRIDAFKHNLHFDRFLPADGSKRPDIDIDFEAHRREDIRQYLVRKYGDDHVATVCAVGTYGTRGIIREAGKALGLSNEAVGFLAKRIHGGVSPEGLEAAFLSRPEIRDSNVSKERFRWVMKLAGLLADVPRNIRSHSSGVVISDRPLWETVPIQWSAMDGVKIIQFDKRSAKHYFDKFDILCLRGQDVLAGTEQRIRLRDPEFDVEQAPIDDEETYRTMRAGQLIGIPQSASPAMRQAHIRMRTSNLHDASLVQAGIRPGVGGAVKINTLIARRRGNEAYSFDHPEMERILGLTYGIIVFQEQVGDLLQTFCGYTSGEAEEIRERIHERRREDYGQIIKDEMMARMRDRGFPIHLANQVFDLVSGFKGYGFAQGHALAFAEISIRSIYCQQNFPAPYFAALLDAQPAGYYGPCTLVNEARVRGVSILPVDINRSSDRFEVEDVKSESDPKLVMPDGGIRLALKSVDGLSKGLRERIFATRPFESMFDFVTKTNPDRDELERLILCGAFDRLHANRRSLLWAIPAAYGYAATVRSMDLPMFIPDPTLDTSVADFLDHEKAIYERRILGLDVAHHLMAFERNRVRARGGVTGAEAAKLADRTQAIVVGNPIRLRFPPTASGRRVVFFDLEDETGLLNVTCFDDVYQRDGHAIICSPYVTLRGETQIRDGHTAFLAHRVFPYRPWLNTQSMVTDDLPITTADFLAR